MVKSFVVILLVIFTSSARAYLAQRGNIHVIAGPFLSQTPVKSDRFSSSPDQGGLGIIILGDVNDSGSLQINTFFFNKLYFRSEGDRTLSEQVSLAHASLGYRYWWSQYFSTSLLLYTSYPMGDVNTVHSDFQDNPAFMTTARENSETGLDAGISVELYRSGRYALMLEGLYSYSLTKKTGEYADHYGVIMGIRYFVQGRERNPQY